MRAIVTGGTGFVGGHLVDLLLERECEVTVFGRNLEKLAQLSERSVEVFCVDLTDLNALRKVFKSVDVVFHCAALSDAWGDYQLFYTQNVIASKNLLTLCEEIGVPKLIYVSSTSVYFDFRHRFNISEDEALNYQFANYYARSKREAEVLLLKTKKTTQVVIIRPRGILGKGDKSIKPRLIRIMQTGFFPLVNGGEAIVDLTHVKNVALALLLAANANNVDGECFNISNNDPLSIKQILKYLPSDLIENVKFFNVSYRILFFIAFLLETFCSLLRLNEPVVTKYSVGLIGKSQVLNITAARKKLKYEPHHSIRDALRD